MQQTQIPATYSAPQVVVGRLQIANGQIQEPTADQWLLTWLLSAACSASLAWKSPNRAKAACLLVLPIVLLAVSSFAAADSFSFKDTLTTPTSTFVQTFNVGIGGTVNIQTWGFGGGANAHGDAIPAGGFDPAVALFAGTGMGATFIDGTSDIQANYYNSTLTAYSSLAGCGPAGFKTIDGVKGICGDVHLSETLNAGNYTLLLTDADYVHSALNAGTGTLGDVNDPGNFADFTQGVFQICAYDPTNPTACAPLTNAYAVDIVTPTAAVPEPGTLFMIGAGLLAGLRKRR